jgi:replicative DNA helicase
MLAEKRLLNAVFSSPSMLDKPEVNADLMSHGITKTLFKSIERLHSSGAAITRDSVLQAAIDVDLDVDSKLIDDVFSASQPVSDVTDIVITLSEGKKRLVAIKHLRDAEKALDEAPLSEPSAITEAREHLDRAEIELMRGDHDVHRVYSMSEWMDKHSAETSARRRGRQWPFYNFVFDSLIVDGAQPGSFGIITASSGSGKSTIALSLMNSLIEMDVPVMMFSLEMAATPTADRLLSSRCQIPYSEIVQPKDEQAYDEVVERLNAEKAALASHKSFRICEDASLSLMDIRKHIKKFQADISRDYCVVIIDLLSMVKEFTSVKGGANFAQMAEIGVNAFSAICKELNVHGVGVVQLNRAVEQEKADCIADLDKFKPHRSAVKNAQAYLERARWVISAFRAKFWAEQFLTPEECDEIDDFIELSVLKQNNGAMTKIRALFDGATFSVIPIENSLETTGGESVPAHD